MSWDRGMRLEDQVRSAHKVAEWQGVTDLEVVEASDGELNMTDLLIIHDLVGAERPYAQPAWRLGFYLTTVAKLTIEEKWSGW